MKRLALLLSLGFLACSSPPPTSPSAPAASSAAATAAASTAAAALPAPGAEEKPLASVTAVAPAKGEAKGLRARVLFSNPSRRACRVRGYKVLWATRSKTVTLDDLTLPPGETRDRWLKVAPEDGDLDALTVEGARVELSAECPPG